MNTVQMTFKKITSLLNGVKEKGDGCKAGKTTITEEEKKRR